MKKLNIIASLVVLCAFCLHTYATVNNEWLKTNHTKAANTKLKIATDSEGYIYLAGTVNTSGQGTNWKLIKLKPNKDTVYTKLFNGSYGGDDYLNV